MVMSRFSLRLRAERKNSTVSNDGIAGGAGFAVEGAFLVTYPRHRIRTLSIIFIFVSVGLIPAAFLIGFWLLMQFFSVGTVATAQTGGVAYLAHIGGAVFGVVTARLFEDPARVGT
jgi:membrane associated rhomboid family serine protease